MSKYPNVTVRLSQTEANMFAVLGRVMTALRRAGVSQEEIDQFEEEATADDYDHAIQTCMRWVDVV